MCCRAGCSSRRRLPLPGSVRYSRLYPLACLVALGYFAPGTVLNLLATFGIRRLNPPVRLVSLRYFTPAGVPGLAAVGDCFSGILPALLIRRFYPIAPLIALGDFAFSIVARLTAIILFLYFSFL